MKYSIKVFDTLTSTNESNLELGSTDAPEGSTHIARTPTRGRGRGDHRWWSPPGAGLWMSTLLRPRIQRSVWPGVSLLAGAAVRQALLELGARNVSLYWPNDVQVGGRKIAGILGEVRAQGEKAWIALGIGINIDFDSPEVRETIPTELAATAISMAESGARRPADPVDTARCVLEKFWPFYEQFNIGRSIPDLVGTHLAHVDQVVEVRLGNQPPWTGRVAGLGEHGELLVRPTPSSGAKDATTEAPLVALTSGEVIYGNPERTDRA